MDLYAHAQQLALERASRMDNIRTMQRHINSLPPETLADIFVALRDSPFVAIELLEPARKAVGPPHSVKKMYGWTKVLLVCKRWNAIARSCPALWSHVNLAETHCWPHIVRAKKAALTLVSLMPHAGVTPSVVLQNHSEQLVQTERLIIQQTPEWKPAFERLKALPLLRDLRLSRNVSSLVHEKPSYDPDFNLPEVFISGDFPRLQSVQLLNYRVDWKYPIFTQNLRTLRIDFTERKDFADLSSGPAQGFLPLYPQPTPVPTFEEIIAALGRMPALEELGLHSCRGREDNLPLGPRVTLTRLKYLSLFGAILPCTQLLEAIKFPASTNISLLTIRRYPTFAQLTALSRVLLEKLNGKHSVGPAELFQCMLVQEEPYCLSQRALRFHFFRHPRINQARIQRLRVLWAMDPTTVWDPSFRGLQILFRDYNPQSSLCSLAPWVIRLCRDWPLQEIRTFMMTIGGKLKAEDVYFICPNIDTLILGTNRSKYPLKGKLDTMVGPRLLYTPAGGDGLGPQLVHSRTAVAPWWPAMQTLVLQPSFTTLSARSIRKLYSYLLAREKECAFEYKELLLFTVDQVKADALEALKLLQCGFPQLAITLHTHSPYLSESIWVEY
ncbi:hypothetical protein BC835DRAFT_1524013 [Cytidiella melzeri]|nr:hypothetical protein BC835DRAFT_1524013 [Cytidiella melzeri]